MDPDGGSISTKNKVPLDCRAGRGLTERCSIAARKYAESAAQLGLANNLTSADWPDMVARVGEALRDAEEAYIALMDHVREHQCVRTERADISAASSSLGAASLIPPTS